MTDERSSFAINLAQRAGGLAISYFRRLDSLVIESKGHQDLVSEADRQVELFIRQELATHYPEDGIVGEEYAPSESRSGLTWVIDPIDGTMNFLHAIPQWCVIIACSNAGNTELAVIHDPISNETFHARRGYGAFVNERPIRASSAVKLSEGVVAIDPGTHTDTRRGIPIIAGILDAGGQFFRSGSGGLTLAYVAAGRLLGYIEEHMKPWDCMAGLLLIEEAGGQVLPPDTERVLHDGAMVIVGGAIVYHALYDLCREPFALP